MPIKALIKTFVGNYQVNCKNALYRSHGVMGTHAKNNRITTNLLSAIRHIGYC